MNTLIGMTVLITTCVFLIWLAVRTRRIRSALLRWSGTCVASLAAMVAAGLIVLSISGLLRTHARNAPVPDLKITATAAQLQRGEAIADGFCGACHSRTGHLTGGFVMGKEFSVPIGSFVSANLTPAGQLSHWSDGEIFRAIRNAVDADGRRLIIMSFTNAGKLSDDDIQSVIAYLRSQPPTGHATVNPPDQFNLLGLIMLGAGMLPSGKPVSTGVITAPRKAATAQFGEYILSYQDCRLCHGADLSGGKPGQLGPIGPGLGLVKGWKLQEFIATMRTGTDPYGHQLSEQMPWRPIGKMDDEELTAVYEYLMHLPDSRSPGTN